MSNAPKYLRVEMPDGSLWDVPVDVIARNRAAYYADEYGDDIERSLAEGTLPFFEKSPGEICEWAVNQMNWSDVEAVAQKVARPPQKIDFEEGWISGNKSIVTKPIVAGDPS